MRDVLDRAINRAVEAFRDHDGRLTREEFDAACARGGATRQEERDAVQACMEAGGLHVHRAWHARRLSTDLLIYEGPRE